MATKTGKNFTGKREDAITAYLVLLPSFILLVTFVIVPLIISVVNSFYDRSAYMDAVWKGMGNYKKVLTDSKFWKAIGVGLKFILAIVPIQLVLAFFIAHLVMQLPKHLSSFVKVDGRARLGPLFGGGGCDLERIGLHHLGDAGRTFRYSQGLLRGGKAGRRGIFRADVPYHHSLYAKPRRLPAGV